MIDRPAALLRLREALRVQPAAALLGPRQCGKTTLAREFAASRPADFFDLENPVDQARLEHPLRALENAEGLVVLDEFQRRPDLFDVLRVLIDRPENAALFLVLGSASPALVRGVSESLAGRVGFVDLGGFDLSEVGQEEAERLWLRGGFPRSFLAESDEVSTLWRDGFVRTFLERDIPQLGISIPAETLRRFWTMIAHYHAQTWNAAEIARSLGVSENTTRRYLEILAGAYMVRVLPPWFENLKKRQKKAPKTYLRDSGLLHFLLGVPTFDALRSHPKLGASWEGFALEQILALAQTRDAYYWATQGGAELDLLLFHEGKRYGFELKYVDAPRTTRSMRIAIADLGLEHLWVVYPGAETYDLDERITVLPLRNLRDVGLPLA